MTVVLRYVAPGPGVSSAPSSAVVLLSTERTAADPHSTTIRRRPTAPSWPAAGTRCGPGGGTATGLLVWGAPAVAGLAAVLAAAVRSR
ncbi:hypothetical protein [Streptomyces puniciscabiei]|uniref:hypothetical protein n=1 Tax=Streptomyces puniciscabiei TaxID=164348 RepID=UPI00114FC8BD|nr:hypothetical protein [Streptomyces puniciscabiei]